MTDALARWFLVEAAEKRTPWHRLDEWHQRGDDGGWVAWIESLREARALRNDDTTMVAVSM